MTIFDFITRADPSGIAIAAPERNPMTYEGLAALVEKTLRSLNGAGLGRTDKVAIVLPNGPLMATAFLTVSAACIAAPLNPNFREDEFRYYMEDLNIKALIVESASVSPALAAAASLGISIIDLEASRSCRRFHPAPAHPRPNPEWRFFGRR